MRRFGLIGRPLGHSASIRSPGKNPCDFETLSISLMWAYPKPPRWGAPCGSAPVRSVFGTSPPLRCPPFRSCFGSFSTGRALRSCRVRRFARSAGMKRFPSCESRNPGPCARSFLPMPQRVRPSGPRVIFWSSSGGTVASSEVPAVVSPEGFEIAPWPPLRSP